MFPATAAGPTANCINLLAHFILTLRSISLPVTGRLDRFTCWSPGMPWLAPKPVPLPLLQVQIAKHALKTLLATNYRFTELVASGAVTDGAEQRIVWLCSGILTNIALHPNNRYGLMLHVALRCRRSELCLLAPPHWRCTLPAGMALICPALHCAGA